MTLEDQIRRMGEARSKEVSTASWRDEMSGRHGRVGRWAVAAVAVAALGVSAVLVVTGDDDAAETIAGESGDTPIRRWVPNSDISFVEYGTLDGGTSFRADTELALVTTPGDAGRPEDDDWTQVLRGTMPLLGFDSSSEMRAITVDGIAILWVPDVDDPADSTVLVSRRFDESSLLGAVPTLAGATDLGDAAEIIAGWADGLEVVYTGPAAIPDVTIWPTKVRWLTTTSAIQAAASYPPVGFGRSFVLGSRDDETVTDPFVWTNDPDMREVNDGEWQEIHRQLAAEITEVSVQLDLQAFSKEERETREEAFPTVSAEVLERESSFTIALTLAEPVTFEDVDAVQVWMFPFILDFRSPFGPAGPTSELVIDTRMSEWEAESLTRLINEGLSERVQSPPPPAYPATTPTEPIACGQPSSADLDRATHLDSDRTPLDIDGDGIDDELFILEAEEGTSVVFARLADGWTGRARTFSGALLQRPDGGAASRDLDDDGWVEFFVTTSTGIDVISLPRCEVADPPNAHFINIDGEWCLPGGCEWRFTCVSDVLLREMAVPGGEFDDHDPADIRWTRLEIRLEPGELVTTPLPYVDYDPADPPPGAPNAESTGVVDCSPDRDGEVVQITRPECAGNAAPLEESDPQSVVMSEVSQFDVDADGFDDDLISFVGEDDQIWLVLHLGDGNYTNAIPVWFNTPSAVSQFRPGLLTTPSGDIAAADITGNGSREFWVGAFGNTGRSASPAGIAGCELRWFTEPSEDGGPNEFFVLIGVGGNSCAPTGCTPRVSCVDGVLITEITGPVEAFDPDISLEDVEVRWTTTVWRHADGEFSIDRESEITFLATERPAAAPSVSDVIDCSP